MANKSKANKIVETVRIDDKDWFLEILCNMVNGNEMIIGLTLNVGGLLVSGELISGDKYFEGFSEEFTNALSNLVPTDDGIEDIKNQITKLGDRYKHDENDEQNKPTNFIHLRNAKFFNTVGSPVPSNRGVWWRGRLSEVSGFMLGSLT